MGSMQQFANYTATQLAVDAEFISWVKCPDAQSDQFWNEYLIRYPHQKGAVEKARAVVLQMKVVKDIMDEDRAETIWNKIRERINPLSVAVSEQKRTVPIRRWTVAAAILIIFLGTGTYFLLSGRSQKELVKGKIPSSLPQQNDIAPGGDKAILTLADGSKVILDTADNGAITKQGSVTVIKLNGQLAYNKEGISSTDVLYNTITTPRGGQYQLVLADGTKVWLNAASSLRFPTAFVGKERKVELTGEGYFEVTHDAAKPFIVTKGQTEVTVLGTHFNINAYEDEPSLKVTLAEGRVMVEKGSRSQLLLPGQQAIVSDQNASIDINKDIDVDHAISWKNGLFDFDDDPLPVVMRQLARWYDADVSYSGAVPEGHYTGAIRRQANLSEVLKMLELAGGVHFSIQGRQIIVEKKS